MLRFLHLGAVCCAALLAVNLWAAPDPNFHCYLLFGQSNMAGGGNTTGLLPSDCDTTPRVKVLAFCDCPLAGSGTWSSPDCRDYSARRVHDEWMTAYPPLHICSEGISIGDWFARTMLDSIHPDITVGLIPCALSGMSLQVFMKGQKDFTIPTWAHPTLGNDSPYDWMLKRCRIAQQSGVIKGMLLHQGESGTGDRFPSMTWGDMAEAVFDSLKKDLGLDNTVPVVVGEIKEGAGINRDIGAFAQSYVNCGLASSKDLVIKDDWHFNPAGMREMGRRYAVAFLSLAGEDYVPRRSTVSVSRSKAPSAAFGPGAGEVKIYSLDGRVLATFESPGTQPPKPRATGVLPITVQQHKKN